MYRSTMAKASAVVLGLALVGAACGSDNSSKTSNTTAKASGGAATTAAGATTSAGGGGGGSAAGAVNMPTGAKCSGLALGFFGAYTGENSGLGIPIYNGEQLAIDQFNQKN